MSTDPQRNSDPRPWIEFTDEAPRTISLRILFVVVFVAALLAIIARESSPAFAFVVTLALLLTLATAYVKSIRVSLLVVSFIVVSTLAWLTLSFLLAG